MPASSLSVAHISDLHFTSKWNWPPTTGDVEWAAPLADLCEDLKHRVKPDVLVVTGDIADNAAWELTQGSLETAWQHALKFLESIAFDLWGRESAANRLFVIPGNHDAKVLGNIQRYELRRIGDSKIFRLSRWPLKIATRLLLWSNARELAPAIEPLFDKRLREALQALPADSRGFRQVFSRYCRSRSLLPDLDLFVICVDSNEPTDSFLNFAQGAVPTAEAQAMREQVREWEGSYGTEFKTAYKLVLLHHHPMPMPLTEGVGGRTEGEEFHLLRNAGSFMNACLEVGADFLMHGHKHARGCSIAGFPEGATGREAFVIGAGSVSQPHNGHFSYNVLRRENDGSWWLDVRGRRMGATAVEGYRPLHNPIRLADCEHRRRRLVSAHAPELTIARFDVVATVDNEGDVDTRYYYTSVEPTHGTYSEHEVFQSGEARRETFDTEDFEDTAGEPNAITGKVRIDPPARPGAPQSFRFGIRHVGAYTFSREYCRLTKKQSYEEFSVYLTATRRFGELFVDITLPEEMGVPLEPKVEVFRDASPGSGNDPRSVEDLLHGDELIPDSMETDACRNGLRHWPTSRDGLKSWAKGYRVMLTVRSPLPGRTYRIRWSLPEDEYEVLNFPRESANYRLNVRVRDAIERFHRILRGLELATAEKHKVDDFLTLCGTAALAKLRVAGPVRVDVAIMVNDNVQVVASIQGMAGSWMPTAVRPRCLIGETLRGKAYLQRAVRSLGSGITDAEKNPNLDPAEHVTQHQTAVPLLHPPDAFYPRVCVLTFSWDTYIVALGKRSIEKQASDDKELMAIGYNYLGGLMDELGIGLPEVALPGAQPL